MILLFEKEAKRVCSFLCRKEKEPKKHDPPNLPFKGGLIYYGQRPPYVKVLVSLSSLCPVGVRDECIIIYTIVKTLRGLRGRKPPYYRVGGKRRRRDKDVGL